MRLIIALNALKDCAYDLKYYSKLRGFIYGLQRDSVDLNQHDKEGYKQYCFSNIFPIAGMKTGDKRTLIISSPNRGLIEFFRGRLEEIKKKEKAVNIGEASFRIEKLTILETRITTQVKIISGTPLVLRIPPDRYDAYGIKSSRPYEYWRPEYDFNALLKQLNDNLLKKYREFYGKTIKSGCVFQEFKFIKSVAVEKIEEGQEQVVIGSMWEFSFRGLNEEQRKLLQFGVDIGLGEWNSSGFGFMNVVR
jgi:CRISPR-associated endoribonuclease Cas6